MAGLPKKYFRMFPGNLKKAWAKYNADRSGVKRAKSSRPGRAAKKSGAPARKPGGAKMAKRAKRAARKAVAKVRRGMDTRPGKVLTMAATATAGGVATSFIVNRTPKVKDMSPVTKSLIQGGAGLAAIFLGRRPWMKGLGAGAVIAGVFGLTKSALKLDPLAGPGAGSPVLSPAQMAALTNGRMNVPASVRMNMPANVRMNGNSPIPGMASGGWGGSW